MKQAIKKMISMLTMSAIVIGITGVLPTSAVTESITFARYDCINETFKSDYTLTTSDVDATSTQTRGIIGEDTRIRTGHSGIVQLTTIDENGNYNYGATGFIVGDHVIACAAHSVLRRKSNMPIRIIL